MDNAWASCLMQEPPRSLVEAYRRYRITTGSLQDHKKRIRQAPGLWRNWAYSRDYSGVSIPGARTWAKRAAGAAAERQRGERANACGH